MKLKKLFFGLVVFLCCSTIFAADPAPLAMLKNTSQQMISELDRHLGNLKGNDRLVEGIVMRVLVPHVDLVSMSRSVVGRNYWDQAASATHQQFTKEFTRYVIRTYSAALESYDGETIKFFPMRGSNSGRVQIDSSILRKDGPPIQVQYRVLNQGSSWLIYDFSIDGVSIVQNYRSQFAATLRQKGLDGLVSELHARNSGRR